MSDEDEYASRLLAPLRAQPATPSRVDIDEAMRVGRQRHLRRRAGIALVAVVTLAASMLGALTGYQRWTTPPATAPTSFDLTVRWLSVPPTSRVTVLNELVTRRAQMLFVTVPGPFDGPVRATVVLYPAGAVVLDVTGQPWLPDVALRAAPIHGQPAYWSPRCRQGLSLCNDKYALFWQWAPQAWVGVYVHIDSTTSLGPDFAIEIANTIRTGPAEPVRTPVAAPAPAGMKLIEVETHWDESSHAATNLLFGYSDRSWTPAGVVSWAEERYVTVALRWDATPPPPNATVRGHPAYVSENGIEIDNVVGEWVLGVAYAGIELSLIEYANSIRVATDPDDPQSWLSPS